LLYVVGAISCIKLFITASFYVLVLLQCYLFGLQRCSCQQT